MELRDAFGTRRLRVPLFAIYSLKQESRWAAVARRRGGPSSWHRRALARRVEGS